MVWCRAAHEWAAVATAKQPLLGVEILRAYAEGETSLTVTVSTCRPVLCMASHVMMIMICLHARMHDLQITVLSVVRMYHLIKSSQGVSAQATNVCSLCTMLTAQ